MPRLAAEPAFSVHGTSASMTASPCLVAVNLNAAGTLMP